MSGLHKDHVPLEEPNVAFLPNPESKYVYEPPAPAPVNIEFLQEFPKPTMKNGVNITDAAKKYALTNEVDPKVVESIRENRKTEYLKATSEYQAIKDKSDSARQTNLKNAESISQKLTKASETEALSLREKLWSTIGRPIFRDSSVAPRIGGKKQIRIAVQTPTVVFGIPHPFDTCEKYLSKRITYGDAVSAGITRAVVACSLISLIPFIFTTFNRRLPKTFGSDWKEAELDRSERIGSQRFFLKNWKKGAPIPEPISESVPDEDTRLCDLVDGEYFEESLRKSYPILQIESNWDNLYLDSVKRSLQNSDLTRDQLLFWTFLKEENKKEK